MKFKFNVFPRIATVQSFTFFMLSTWLLISSCGDSDCIRGSGNAVSESRTVQSFSGIEVKGSVKVIIQQDSARYLVIKADDNILPEIDTRVSGNTLKVEVDEKVCRPGPITLLIRAPEFEKIKASGAVEIISDGRLNVKDLSLELNGSNSVKLNLSAANIKTSSSGVAKISLEGQAGSHQMDLSGSSKVEALNFVVGNYKIESSGASTSRINVLNDLEIQSSGSSNIEYRGNPTNIKKDESGASNVKRID